MLNEFLAKNTPQEHGFLMVPAVVKVKKLKCFKISAPEPSEEKKSPKPAKKGHKKSSSGKLFNNF